MLTTASRKHRALPAKVCVAKESKRGALFRVVWRWPTTALVMDDWLIHTEYV